MDAITKELVKESVTNLRIAHDLSLSDKNVERFREFIDNSDPLNIEERKELMQEMFEKLVKTANTYMAIIEELAADIYDSP